MADETSLRDDLSAAFEAAEKAPATGDSDRQPETAQPEVSVATPAEPIGGKPEGEKSRDEKGRFAPKIGDKPEEKQKELPLAAEKQPEAAKPVEAKPEPEKPAEPERPKVRAPASWKPVAREGWDKLPSEVQQEVIRREREISHTLNETAEARQTHQKFRETVAPFEAMIRAEGVEPIQAVGNLLRTAATLATGPAQTKAQIVAGLIKTYGVDIATLDSLLSGQAAPQPVQQYQPPNPAQFRDPRLDALLEQQTQRVQQQAVEALADVEQEEFFDDVRQDMADLLEVASKRGIALSARDAYTRAVALHPEVSRVLEQRKAAATQGATQRAMAASSSVRAQPATGPSATGSTGSLREDLEAAFERSQSRR